MKFYFLPSWTFLAGDTSCTGFVFSVWGWEKLNIQVCRWVWLKCHNLKEKGLWVIQFSLSWGIALIDNINHKIHTTKMLNWH